MKMVSLRRKRQSGHAMFESVLVLMPLMAMILAIVDFTMPIFLKSTFMHAVREGCRFGITMQARYNGMIYPTQTAAIKAVVQDNAMGFLAGTSGLSHIKVEYKLPIAPYSQVTGPGANTGGNILIVSIRNYNWSWIVPLWRGATPLSINAASADRLEPVSANVPVP